MIASINKLADSFKTTSSIKNFHGNLISENLQKKVVRNENLFEKIKKILKKKIAIGLL